MISMASDGFKDYFKILGVSRNATNQEIKIAFRKLARKFHPDLHPHNEMAESEFKEINEAYEILSDEDKKKSYEQFLNYWFKNRDGKSRDFSRENNNQQFDEYLNFDDFLSDLIGRFSEVGQEIYSNISSDKNAQSLNLDAEFNLQISFLEALNGTKKNLLVNDERIEVKIPKGIETGSKIRIKNKGNIQSGKGKRGDLLIEVSIKSHPIWKVKGLDIYADLPIKGTKGMTSAEKCPENMLKGILRHNNDISVFRDGTIRFDMVDITMTHFKPKEISLTAEKARELGYEVESDESVVELFPQDIVVSRECAEVMLKTTQVTLKNHL